MKSGKRSVRAWSWISDMSLTVLLSLSILLLLADKSTAKITQANEENCEVCVKFLGKFIDNLPADAHGNPAKIEKELIKACKIAKKADNRFCYYVGGTADAATSILGEITKPVSWSMPAEKICLKLVKKDAQICDLRYDRSIDYVNMNLKKMKVKDLKKILTDWDDACRGCTEKSDYVKRIEELLPKYAPEAAAARAAKNEL